MSGNQEMNGLTECRMKSIHEMNSTSKKELRLFAANEIEAAWNELADWMNYCFIGLLAAANEFRFQLIKLHSV